MLGPHPDSDITLNWKRIKQQSVARQEQVAKKVDEWTPTETSFVSAAGPHSGAIQSNPNTSKELGSFMVASPPTPEELAGLYLDMKASGAINKVFHQADPDLKWFLDWTTGPDSLVVGAWRTVPDAAFLGCGFLNNFHRMNSLFKGDVGFAFMDATAPLSIFSKSTLIAAMTDWVFLNTELESICGLTPEPNAGAVALVRRVGFRVFGPVPNYTVFNGKPCGAYISQMDASTWLNGRSKREKSSRG